MADPNNPLKKRATELGLSMVHRELIPSTRLAHEAAEFARQQDRSEQFHRAVLKRYWGEGADLSLKTLRAAATEAGLDAEALSLALETHENQGKVEARLAEGRAMGVQAVPTFLVADALVIQGAQTRAVFRQALERVGAPRRPAARG